MKKPSNAILLVVLILCFGCEPNELSFEDTIPGMYTLTTQVSPDQAGTIHPSEGVFDSGEEIQIEARSAEGYIFDHWEGDLTGNSNPATIVADTNKRITANFINDVDFGITVQEVNFYIREMKLDGARRTRDFKIKDFILNIPLDGSPFEITHVDIPRGSYDELELEIRKPENKIDIDNSDFRDGSGSYSLVVKGTFNGVDFTYRSAEDFEIDVDFSPYIEIKSGQTTVIAITIDFADWFEEDNGGLLDPNDSLNKKQINKNIEDSFSDFEDEFQGG